MKAHLVALWLLMVPAAIAQQAPQMPVRLPEISPDRISVQGIAMMGGERYAALSFTPSPGRWMKAGEGIGRFTITAVEENSVKLAEMVHGETKAEFTKSLGEGTVKDAEEANEPARYSRAWINSKANPMLYHSLPLPGDTAMNWSKLSEKQKEEIIAYYRQYGWQLRYTVTNDGLTSGFAWDNIYDKDRQEVRKMNYEAFVKTLSEEQLAEWKKMRSAPILRAGVDGPIEAQLAEARRRQARFKAFQATLSPAQLDAFSARDDFTKHDWTK